MRLLTRAAVLLAPALCAWSVLVLVLARAGEDDYSTAAWLGDALLHRGKLLPAGGKSVESAASSPVTYSALVINKRYVLDRPIQGSFLISSPNKLEIWWAPWNHRVSLNENFILDSRFSKGGCGEVWLAKDLRDLSRRFVLKRVFPEKLASGRREVYFGDKLRGMPRIARFIEAFNRTAANGVNELWLVFEDEGESLKNLLYETSASGAIVPSTFWRKMRESGKRGFAVRRQIARQLVLALHELEERRIVHRDVKPGNILLGTGSHQGEVSVKLCDFGSAIDESAFGLALFGEQGPTREEHTRAYEPPELSGLKPNEGLDPSIFDSSYDAWSLGITLLEILLGTDSVFEIPSDLRRRSRRRKHAEANPNDVYITALIDFGLDDEERFAASVRTVDPFGRGFADDTENSALELNFVFGLLRLHPNERFTFQQATVHPYIRLAQGEDEGREVNVAKSIINVPFRCGHCEREFSSFAACDAHARTRGHRSVQSNHISLCLSTDTMPWSECSDYTVLSAPAGSQVWCGHQGGRAYSEDFFIASQDAIVVTDGHWGENAARFTSEYVFSNLPNVVNQDPGRWKIEILTSTLTTLFINAHNAFLNSPTVDDSGSALTAILIRERIALVANVGDVRALACCDTDGAVKVLTEDHLASMESEQRLVQANGASIELVGGRYRVNGRLALTRALGDRQLADVLLHVPFVSLTNLTNPHWSFLIVGTDGLFDSMSNEEAIAIVRLEAHSNAAVGRFNDAKTTTEPSQPWYAKAARRLIHEARARGLTQDNLGVAIIPL